MLELTDFRLYTKIELILSKMELFEERLNKLENELEEIKKGCYNIPQANEQEKDDGK